MDEALHTSYVGVDGPDGDTATGNHPPRVSLLFLHVACCSLCGRLVTVTSDPTRRLWPRGPRGQGLVPLPIHACETSFGILVHTSTHSQTHAHICAHTHVPRPPRGEHMLTMAVWGRPVWHQDDRPVLQGLPLSRREELRVFGAVLRRWKCVYRSGADVCVSAVTVCHRVSAQSKSPPPTSEQLQQHLGSPAHSRLGHGDHGRPQRRGQPPHGHPHHPVALPPQLAWVSGQSCFLTRVSRGYEHRRRRRGGHEES